MWTGVSQPDLGPTLKNTVLFAVQATYPPLEWQAIKLLHTFFPPPRTPFHNWISTLMFLVTLLPLKEEVCVLWYSGQFSVLTVRVDSSHRQWLSQAKRCALGQAWWGCPHEKSSLLKTIYSFSSHSGSNSKPLPWLQGYPGTNWPLPTFPVSL